MKADQIVREITRRAWSFGVPVLLSPDRYIDTGDGIRCSGYFTDGDQPMLAVACGRPSEQWLGTLLHEYSHLTQWAENAPVWREDRSAAWADWLNGKRVKDIKARIAKSRELEADCERRTVRLARELQAPIDLEQYIRGANSYIHFYNVMAETRKWYATGRGPYDAVDVLALANPTLDEDYSTTPKPLWDALLTCV